MGLQYRALAKASLAKATDLLNSNDDAKLKYACLDLRECIESLAYDLLTAYLKEVPLKALTTWQPDKVMRELLRIDPYADQSSHIRVRREGRDGEPDGRWSSKGEDRRLDSEVLSRSYQTLGNFLHVPTIKQAAKNTPFDAKVVRERAGEIRSALAHVLDAKIWNANFGDFSTFNCTECEAPIQRRKAVLERDEDVECGNCGQKFIVEPQSDGTFFFIPASFSWECAACKVRREIVQSKAREGLDVSCPACKDPVKLTFKQSWKLVREADQTPDSA